MLYTGAPEFTDRVSAFVHGGLENGDHVVMAVSPEKSEWVRDELGRDARAVEYADARALYDHHGLMLTSILEYLKGYGGRGTRRLRLVAERELEGQSPADLRAYLRYEAAANVLFRAFDASVLCPYDASRLASHDLEAVVHTHPQIVGAGPNRQYMDPRSFVRAHSRPTTPPAESARHPIDVADDVASARALVRTAAGAVGLAPQSIDDLSLAVSEVATNALRHGVEPRWLSVYICDGHLVCQITDAGAGPPDPLAGYLPPAGGSNGYGLWLAHQLCDIVEVASDADSTSVLLRIRLAIGA